MLSNPPLPLPPLLDERSRCAGGLAITSSFLTTVATKSQPSLSDTSELEVHVSLMSLLLERGVPLVGCLVTACFLFFGILLLFLFFLLFVGEESFSGAGMEELPLDSLD